jgi:hypothetical protein
VEYSSSLRFDSQTCEGVAFSLHKPSYGRVLEFDRKNAEYREKARQLTKQSSELQEEIDAVRAEYDRSQESKLKSLKAQLASASDEAKPAIQPNIDRINDGYEYERLIARAPHIIDPEHRAKLAQDLVALQDKPRDEFKMPRDLVMEVRTLNEQMQLLRADSYNSQRIRWGCQSIEGLSINGMPATVETLLSDGPVDLTMEILAKVDEVNSMTPEQLRNFCPPSISGNPERKAKTDTPASAA